MLKGHEYIEIDKAYSYIVSIALKEINDILLFGNHELALVNNKYIIREITEKIELDTPQIQIIDREYIKKHL